MKSTVQYTNELSNFEMNKIPLEQQICLMKAPESVKEKAMTKFLWNNKMPGHQNPNFWELFFPFIYTVKP